MQLTQTIAITSGFFNPLHSAHLELFKAAKEMSDIHIVGVNSDECCLKKTGKNSFMPFNERLAVINALKYVDCAVGFDDSDGTACKLLEHIYFTHKKSVDQGLIRLLFCNGGDRQHGTTPEETFVEERLNGKVTMVYGVGGFEKGRSSSDFLKKHVLETWEKYNGDMEAYKQNKY